MCLNLGFFSNFLFFFRAPCVVIKSANALRKRYSPAKAVAQTLYCKPVGGGGGGGANVVLPYANATTAPALRSRVCGVGVGGGALTQRHALRASHCRAMAGRRWVTSVRPGTMPTTTATTPASRYPERRSVTPPLHPCSLTWTPHPYGWNDCSYPAYSRKRYGANRGTASLFW